MNMCSTDNKHIWHFYPCIFVVFLISLSALLFDFMVDSFFPGEGREGVVGFLRIIRRAFETLSVRISDYLDMSLAIYCLIIAFPPEKWNHFRAAVVRAAIDVITIDC